MSDKLPKNRRRRWLFGLLIVVAVVGAVSASSIVLQYRLNHGRTLLRQREFEAARQLLQTAVENSPDSGAARYWLARANRRTGRLNEVIPLLEDAQRLGFPRERIERERWLTLAQSGRITEAEAFLPQLLQDPQDDGKEICEAYFHGFRANLRFTEANMLLDVWQADFPEDAEPHFLRGLASEMLGRSQMAADSYRKGLQLSPDRTDYHHRLAQTLLKLNELKSAEEHFGRCLRDTPDHLDALAGRATCLAGTGKPDEAAVSFRRVLGLDPNHFEARLGLGQLLLAQRQPEEAVRWLQPLVEQWPGDVQARYALVQALQATGQTELAQEHLRAYQESLEKLDRLEKLFEEVAESPDDVQKRYDIGISLLEHHSRQNGEAWLKSVLQLDPAHRGAHEALAAFYARQGKTDLANQHRQMAGSAQP